MDCPCKSANQYNLQLANKRKEAAIKYFANIFGGGCLSGFVRLCLVPLLHFQLIQPPLECLDWGCRIFQRTAFICGEKHLKHNRWR